MVATTATASAAAAGTTLGMVVTAGAEVGRMHSFASSSTGFPLFLGFQQHKLRISAAASTKFPSSHFTNSPSPSSVHTPGATPVAAAAAGRWSQSRSMSSALHAVSPDSPENASSVTTSPPPPDGENEDGTSTAAAGEGSTSGAQEWGSKAPERFKVRSGQVLNILGGAVGAVLRFGTGAFILGYKLNLVPSDQVPGDRYASFEVAGRKTVETGSPGPRPELPIELYEFEGCPFCRKVREIVSILDLDVLFYPTPKNGPNFRPKAIQMGGKSQFPYMVDPNTGVSMYESDDIIKYLVEKYGNGKVPIALSLGLLTTITAGFAMLARAGKGSGYTPSRLPAEPLKLWAYEISPFCKLVREKLVELELPHYYYSTPRGSKKRDELFQRAGHFQVPYLEDPNTGVKMFESADIVEYLQQTYAIPASPTAA
ncbi:unnamed protein product [Calypogeia fissa]